MKITSGRMPLFASALCLLLLLSCVPLSAQRYYFANYTVDDGLPHTRINAMLQSRSGYIWLATNMGISRFDGRRFYNYTVKDGLGDNKVTTLYETTEGHLLSGHENGSLTYWNGKHFTVFQLHEDTRRIFCISSDKKGNLWIGTQGTGVFRLEAGNILERLEKRQFTRFDYSDPHRLAHNVMSVVPDTNDCLLLLTDLGIKSWDPATEKFSFFQPKGVDVVQFTSIAFDDREQLWLGTIQDGVYVLSKNRKDIARYTVENGALGSNFVSSLYLTRKGEMLIGTWGGGLSMVKDRQVERIDESNGLSENKVRCLLEDREGNWWTGSNQNGVSCLRNKKMEVVLRSRDGTNTQISAVYRDSRNRMWLGSTNCVYLLEPGTDHHRKIALQRSGEDIEVTAIIEDRNRNIWVSTWGEGVFLINPLTFSVQPFLGKMPSAGSSASTPYIHRMEKHIHTLKQDSRGNIWMSSLHGLIFFNPVTNYFHTYTKKEGLADNNTTDIQEDSRGRIWIGSASGGLTLYENAALIPVRSAQPAIHPAVSSIAIDRKGRVWIGTEGGGIYSFDGEKYTHYTTTDGILSNYVSLVEAGVDGRIWLGTNKGICCFDPATGKSIVYDKIDKQVRIETKTNSVWCDQGGRMWFGTINGVVMIDPAGTQTNPVEPITRIDAVKVFQDTISGNGIELNFRRNYLSFYFKGLCFSDPDKVEYQYQLEGFDNTWQPSTNVDFVTYNNLPPGRYTFKVRSCNNHGLWNREPVMFSFIITPPFWTTWWFYLVCGVSVFLLVVGYIKFRERTLRLEKKHLEQVVSERTAEIVRQKEEIESQRDELRVSTVVIEQKNQAITDSIRYAKRIQLATLPSSGDVGKNLPDSFILYNPKDIVSGDFYAVARKNTTVFVAVADCTGHGVPGAFMSMIGTNLFNQLINEKGVTEPAEILNQLNEGIERALKQEATDNHDGMDIVICSLDMENNRFEYAGANRPLWIMRGDQPVSSSGNGVHERIERYGKYMELIRPDKQPIGGYHQQTRTNFTNHTFLFFPGDTLYLFTDGYADQFGGPEGKKLLSKRFRDYLIEIRNEPMPQQEKLLNTYFENWRGNNEQVDDVLVVGIRYPS